MTDREIQEAALKKLGAKFDVWQVVYPAGLTAHSVTMFYGTLVRSQPGALPIIGQTDWQPLASQEGRWVDLGTGQPWHPNCTVDGTLLRDYQAIYALRLDKLNPNEMTTDGMIEIIKHNVQGMSAEEKRAMGGFVPSVPGATEKP